MTSTLTAESLARQIEQHRAEWPDDLTRKAMFALNALRFTDERKPAARALRAGDLKAFADGYDAWAESK